MRNAQQKHWLVFLLVPGLRLVSYWPLAAQFHGGFRAVSPPPGAPSTSPSTVTQHSGFHREQRLTRDKRRSPLVLAP